MSPPARRRLYIVWLVLAILLAGIIVHEVTDIFEPAMPSPSTGRLPMFAFHEPELSRVQVIHQGRVTALMRDTTGAWFHHGANHGHRHEHGGHSNHHYVDANAQHAAEGSEGLPISPEVIRTLKLVNIESSIRRAERIVAGQRRRHEKLMRNGWPDDLPGRLLDNLNVSLSLLNKHRDFIRQGWIQVD